MVQEELFENQHRKCPVDKDSNGERYGVGRSGEGYKAGFVLVSDLGGHLKKGWSNTQPRIGIKINFPIKCQAGVATSDFLEGDAVARLSHSRNNSMESTEVDADNAYIKILSQMPSGTSQRQKQDLRNQIPTVRKTALNNVITTQNSLREGNMNNHLEVIHIPLCQAGA